MSNIEIFDELLAQNDEAKTKIDILADSKGDAPDEFFAGIIAIAKEYGIILSEEEIKANCQELSETKLMDISAGTNLGRRFGVKFRYPRHGKLYFR